MTLFCPHCQYPNFNDATLCRRCRRELPAICPSCGAPKTPGAEFCSLCGFIYDETKVDTESYKTKAVFSMRQEKADSEDALGGLPEPSAENSDYEEALPSPVAGFKKCPKCIHDLDARARVCIYCGHIFKEQPVAAPAVSPAVLKKVPKPEPQAAKKPAPPKTPVHLAAVQTKLEGNLPPRPRVSAPLGPQHPWAESGPETGEPQQKTELAETETAKEETPEEPSRLPPRPRPKPADPGEKTEKEPEPDAKPPAEEKEEAKPTEQPLDEEEFSLFRVKIEHVEVGDNEPAGLVPLSAQVTYTSPESVQPRSEPIHKGDPNSHILIPAGEFIFGRVGKTKKIEAFFLDTYPVTNEQYRRFVEEAGVGPPLHWLDGRCIHGTEKYPVTLVGFEYAKAYARWAGKRLPTELEWERAARGLKGLPFPWGTEFDPSNLHADPSRGCLMPVDAHPDGASPEGIQDLLGNAAEWVEEEKTRAPVIRGGTFLDPPETLKTVTRILPFDGGPKAFIGFRCAMDP